MPRWSLLFKHCAGVLGGLTVRYCLSARYYGLTKIRSIGYFRAVRACFDTARRYVDIVSTIGGYEGAWARASDRHQAACAATMRVRLDETKKVRTRRERESDSGEVGIFFLGYVLPIG